MPEEPKVEQQEVLHENNPYFYLGSPTTQPPVNPSSFFLQVRYWSTKAVPIIRRLFIGAIYYAVKGIRFLINAILSQIGFRK